MEIHGACFRSSSTSQMVRQSGKPSEAAKRGRIWIAGRLVPNKHARTLDFVVASCPQLLVAHTFDLTNKEYSKLRLLHCPTVIVAGHWHIPFNSNCRHSFTNFIAISAIMFEGLLDLDWFSLVLPFSYIAVLAGSLITFSSVYRKRIACQ
jgi:hypothetical protein